MKQLLYRLAEVFTPHAGWFALLAALGLAWIGIAAIGTATAGGSADYAARQAQWLFVAVLVMLATLLPHPKRINLWAYPLMAGALLLLALLVLPGMPESLVPVRNGVQAWFDLKVMSLQPAELAKIACVLALARYLRHRDSYRSLRGLLVPFAILFVPVGLILKQPDLGTAIVFPVMLFAVLIAAGARLRHMGTLALVGALALALNVAVIWFLPDSMQILKPYQVNRVRAMIDLAGGGTQYLATQGYQQDKAMTLAGAGGLRGVGRARAEVLLRFNHLPEAHNDMIFPVIVNRWGLLGGGVVLGLYALLIGSLAMVAARSKDPFVRLAMVGFAALVFAQSSVNIGMSLGILPVIGVTLPFVSYGGSSLVASFAMIGLAMSFAAQQPAIISLPSFEFDRGSNMPRSSLLR